MGKPKRDANWVDGLRGVASFIVVCGHLCTSFAPNLHSPSTGPGETPLIFQRPILRICVGGRSAVALFFLITGYVNSIGPLGRAKAGNADAAFSRIAHSALARSARLMLPAFFATLLTWFLANVNGYHLIRHVDATWIRQGYTGPEANLGAAIKKLIRCAVETWTIGWNDYDGTQWTLILFLEGSMMVYLTMICTVLVTPTARRIVFGIIYVYGWLCWKTGHGSIKTLNIVVGMVVADMHVTFGDRATSMVPRFVPFLFMLLGLFLCSFPQDNYNWAPWSDVMSVVMRAIIPEKADVRRYWDSLGACTIFIAIFFSQPARNLLTSRWFNFLGRVSFPVYLIHNTLIKTVLSWMLYLPSYLAHRVNEKGEPLDWQRPGRVHFAFALVGYYYVLYRVAHLWTVFLDPLFDRWVKAGMSWAHGEGGQAAQGKSEPILAK